MSAILDMCDVAWYMKVFAPLIVHAKKSGINVHSSEAFMSWINGNKDRKAQHAGIQWWVAETKDQWSEMITEILHDYK